MNTKFNINLQYHQIKWFNDTSFILHHNTMHMITDLLCIVDNKDNYNCNYKILNPNEILVFFKKRTFNIIKIVLNVSCTHQSEKIYKYKFNKLSFELFNKILVKTSDNIVLTNLSNKLGDEIQVLTPPNLKYPITLFKIN